MTDHHCEDRPLSDFEHQLKSMTPALGHLLPAEVFYRAGWNAAVAALEDTPVNCVSSGVNREGLCGRPDVCQTRMDRAAEVGGGSGERRLDGCDRGTHRRLKAFATGGGIFAAGLACGLLLMIGMGTLGDSRASVDSDAGSAQRSKRDTKNSKRFPRRIRTSFPRPSSLGTRTSSSSGANTEKP